MMRSLRRHGIFFMTKRKGVLYLDDDDDDDDDDDNDD